VLASNGLGMSLACLGVAGTTSTCTIPVRIGDSISFFARPGSLSVLNSIAGCVADPFDPNGAGCFPPFSMTGPKTVSARFRGPKTVTVSFAGTGSGTVVGPFVSCPSSGGNCASPIPIGAYEMAAIPAPDSDFLAWTGACAGQGATCYVTVTEDFAVGVDFKLKNRRPVAVHGGPYAAGRNIPITFNGAGSSDANGDALNYFWNFIPVGSATGVAPVNRNWPDAEPQLRHKRCLHRHAARE
jgi:hypothetical protein